MQATVEAFQDSAIVATIVSGTTKSNVIDLGPFAQAGFVIPTGFSGTSVTFEVSLDGVNFFALNKNTSDVAESVTVTAGKAYPFPISTFPWKKLKLVSSTNESGAIATRTILIAAKY